jgi:hypothetical protein
MWVFTVYGFFSVVCARKGVKADQNRLMVRARARRHLEDLRLRFPKELRRCKIIESLAADYQFRMFVSKRSWRTVMAGLVSDVNYSNFKSQVMARRADDRDYNAALHDVWGRMHDMQNVETGEFE